VPFDLRTDRYLEYDRDKPAAAGDQLIQALRATIDSERRDSPVFLLLPELKPPKREAFLIVPEEFGKEVDRARNERQPGDLALLTAEARSFSWEVSALRTVGRAQFKLKAFAAARTTWERVLEFSENDVKANLLLGTIYQRLGDLTASNAVLRENVEAALAIPELGGEETKPQKPLHVFLFTGHQIDSPGRKTPRFPPDREDVARREIKAKIEQEMRGLTDAPKLARLSQLTHRFSEFFWFDGCKVLIFLHARPEKGL
jgi:hypothetical protein